MYFVCHVVMVPYVGLDFRTGKPWYSSTFRFFFHKSWASSKHFSHADRVYLVKENVGLGKVNGLIRHVTKIVKILIWRQQFSHAAEKFNFSFMKLKGWLLLEALSGFHSSFLHLHLWAMLSKHYSRHWMKMSHIGVHLPKLRC